MPNGGLACRTVFLRCWGALEASFLAFASATTNGSVNCSSPVRPQAIWVPPVTMSAEKTPLLSDQPPAWSPPTDGRFVEWEIDKPEVFKQENNKMFWFNVCLGGPCLFIGLPLPILMAPFHYACSKPILQKTIYSQRVGSDRCMVAVMATVAAGKAQSSPLGACCCFAAADDGRRQSRLPARADVVQLMALSASTVLPRPSNQDHPL